MNFLRKLFNKNIYATDSRIFYGPFRCESCKKMICRVCLEMGGKSFDYPDEPIYPNTRWSPHYCTGGKI
jgi:hypothetical protein